MRGGLLPALIRCEQFGYLTPQWPAWTHGRADKTISQGDLKRFADLSNWD